MNVRFLVAAASAITLSALFSVEAAAAIPAASKSREVCGTGGSGLNFRSGPSLHANVKSVLPEGHDMTLLGISANGKWLQVKDNGSGRTGWVYREFSCRKGDGAGSNAAPGAGGGIPNWRNPVMGACVTSDFGPRSRPCRGCSAYHRGTDLGAGCGTPIKAAAPGTVIFSGYDSGLGNYVAIRHTNGVVSYYGHMSRRNVSPGTRVGADTVLGKVGSTGASTGCHLHFEVRRNGVAFDAQSLIGQGNCPRFGRATGNGGSTVSR